ncbi:MULTISPECIES: hypothetical protein [Paenibacillus]|uniref:hypothetical protein n=1 Tax=Paenibacillus TaxID=44249 RepID=UPI0008FB17E2|nr:MULTISPECIES: hypothetical protein [Paenibacillus]APB75631.1 hypothetical protein PPYC2_11855 [Paenibacillus polymyxa]POR25534.1 hypothetical protein CG775_21680 [Paenibacillus polymyxa]QYK62585.1 hypothetical protein KAI37_02915 [Paenibacillus sp. S25]QYK68261.1 hypothetical protein KAI36_03412 [Paenibacillus sp. S02]
MQPLVFDGVGIVQVYETGGKLKFLDERISKVTLQLQFDWDKVMGGDSGYAFHYTAKDLGDKASMEVPRYSDILAELSQGAESEKGTVFFDETEQGFLNTTDGYKIKAPTKFGGTLVAASDRVYLKDSASELTELTRVASTPTAEQYVITADGTIKSDVANEGKLIVVTFKWSKENATRSSLSGKRRPKPFKLVHRFSLVDDRDGKEVPCQLTIWKALGGGTLDVSQERKKPTSNTLSLEIMEPDITPENPNGYAVEIIFGI